MCWHHDIELEIKGVAVPGASKGTEPAPASPPPRLTDIALLVGNLYAAGTQEENPSGAFSESSGC